MPRTHIVGCLAALCLAVTGCAAMDKALGRVPRTTYSEKLPLRGDPIRMLAHVAAAARAKGGLEVDAQRKQVSFSAGEWTDVDFNLDDDQVELQVTIAGKAPAGEKDALMESGRKLAAELWATAEQTLHTEVAAEAERAQAELRAQPVRTDLAPPASASAPFGSVSFQLPGFLNPAGHGQSAAAQSPANLTCCVNRRGYSCPDSDAVYKCSGEFAQCILGCGMGDMNCSDGCLRDHPMNPSRCHADSNVACR